MPVIAKPVFFPLIRGWLFARGQTPIGYCRTVDEWLVDEQPEVIARARTLPYDAQAEFVQCFHGGATSHPTAPAALRCHDTFLLDTRLSISEIDDALLQAIGMPTCEAQGMCGALPTKLVRFDEHVFHLCGEHAVRDMIIEVMDARRQFTLVSPSANRVSCL